MQFIQLSHLYILLHSLCSLGPGIQIILQHASYTCLYFLNYFTLFNNNRPLKNKSSKKYGIFTSFLSLLKLSSKKLKKIYTWVCKYLHELQILNILNTKWHVFVRIGLKFNINIYTSEWMLLCFTRNNEILVCVWRGDSMNSYNIIKISIVWS